MEALLARLLQATRLSRSSVMRVSNRLSLPSRTLKVWLAVFQPLHYGSGSYV